jgi:hypothetical protein
MIGTSRVLSAGCRWPPATLGEAAARAVIVVAVAAAHTMAAPTRW